MLRHELCEPYRLNNPPICRKILDVRYGFLLPAKLSVKEIIKKFHSGEM